jgi:hypothetical protein
VGVSGIGNGEQVGGGKVSKRQKKKPEWVCGEKEKFQNKN